MIKAVFLDRDGVINELVFNPQTGEYESPHTVENLIIFPYAIDCLKSLIFDGFELFLISNQPSYAKGKTTLENLNKIHEELHKYLSNNNISFQEYYYCYHHPSGIIPEYTKICNCRKPGNYFLEDAIAKYNINRDKSFLIGDCDTDIECGRKSNLNTILINNPLSIKKRGKSNPKYTVNNLIDAVNIIKYRG